MKNAFAFRPSAAGLLYRISLAILVLTAIAPLPLSAQPGSVLPRISRQIDDTRRVTLTGNRHPLAAARFDRGPAPDDMRMDRMLLVIKRSPEQEIDLKSLLDSQQDQSSSDYHRWLTPEEFGERFGASIQDLETIRSWLAVQGFQVNTIGNGLTFIEFSGTAGQVRQAFSTEIHRYEVNGESHWANRSNPQIPEALSPVVEGVATLHDFHSRPQAQALVSWGGGHALSPADYSTIYSLGPLYNTAGINGSGVTIGIVGRSNINIQDVKNFRKMYGLPDNPPQVVLNGPDPGILPPAKGETISNEESEAVLDATWAGAVGRAATVKLVVSKSTSSTDGVQLSALYIVENNLADVMSESFGICESVLGATNIQAHTRMAEQAAAQGITYVVSSGDSGSAGCYSSTDADTGLAVNALASTPYTVAVGGTQFEDTGYWNQDGSAKSYIPEKVWNESDRTCPPWWEFWASCSGGLWASGGGVSISQSKPAWQTGVTGIPNDNRRDVPDVSLAAAGQNGYIICIEGACPYAPIGGTSAAAPSFAGMMALVNQKTKARQGQPNYILYKLAAKQDYSKCNGSAGVPLATCVFNDIAEGDNAVPGSANPQYKAGTGYDLATGLGSVNAYNMVSQWSSVSFASTTTALSISSAGSLSAGSSATFAVTVSPKGGTGKPTGDVTLTASLGESMGLYTLTNGTITQATKLLPAGTYSVVAHYAGDGTYAASDSAPVAVTVTGPRISITPGGLSFGNSNVGAATAVQSISLKNNGNAALTGIKATLTGANAGDFSQTTTCGSSLVAGAGCQVTVAFKPTASGPRTATVSIADSATGPWAISPDSIFYCEQSGANVPAVTDSTSCAPQSIAITGVGVAAAAVSLSPTSLSFASTSVGSASSAQTITLKNAGTATLTISSISETGSASDFPATIGCGASLASGASCTILVTFKPTATGARSATVAVTDNAPGSPHTVPVSGTGTGVAAAKLTPATLSFPSTNVGSASNAQTVTLNNTGTATLTISKISMSGNSGDFPLTTNCGTSVAAGATCAISVTFKPTATGARSATVAVTDNAPGSPHAVPVSGTGTGVAAAKLTPATLSFPSTNVGSASNAQTVTLNNTGTATLTISKISMSGNGGDFPLTTNCGTSVAAGATCTISVTFKPTATGARSATVAVTDNAPGSPHTVPVGGTGTGVAAAKLTPATLSFPSTNVGSASNAQTVTLNNTGTATLTISKISMSGNSGDFPLTTNCGTSVAAGATCTISVTFKPTATGARSATVAVTDNATGSPQTVTASGTGLAPAVSLSPNGLSFPNTKVGSASGSQTLTLKNTGTAVLTISSIVVSGNASDFPQTHTCGGSMAAGASCTISMKFQPTAKGARTATLAVTDNAIGSPHKVTVSGTGL